MPLRRVVRGHQTRRNVEEQEEPNAPKVLTQWEVANGEFREAICMASQAKTNQVGQQRGARQQGAEILYIQGILKDESPKLF